MDELEKGRRELKSGLSKTAEGLGKAGVGLLKAALGLLKATVGLTVAAVVFLTTDFAGNTVRDQILSAAAPAFPNGSLHIESIDMNLVDHIDVNGIEIRDLDGKALVSISQFSLAYSLEKLLTGKVDVDHIRIEEPVIDLTVNESGEMDLAMVFGPTEEEPEEKDEPSEPFAGIPVDVVLSEFAINSGRIHISDPAGNTDIPHLAFKLGAEVQGSTVWVNGIDMDINLDEPIDQLVRLDGGLVLENGDLKLDLDALRLGGIAIKVGGQIGQAETSPVLGLDVLIDPIDPDTVAALAGESLLNETGRMQIDVDGPLSALAVDSTLTSASKQGELNIRANLDLEAEPLVWAAALEPKQFALHALTSAVPEPFVLNGRYAVKGSGTEYPSGIQATVDMEGSDQNFAGEVVHALGIKGALNDGIFDLNALAVDHAAADVAVKGQVDLVKSKAKLNLSADIPNASALSKYGAEGLGGAVRFGGDVVAGWDPEVTVDLTGDLGLTRFKGPGVFITKGGGPIKAKVRGEAAEGEGSITLSGLDASGTNIDVLRVDFKGGQGADGSVDVGAEMGIGLIEMPDGQFDMEGLSGQLVASIPKNGELAAEANLNVQTFRFGDEDYEVDGGPVVFSMKGDAIKADIDLRREDAPFLVGKIRGDAKTGEWKVEGFRFAVLKDNGLNSEQNIRFRLAEGGAEDVQFELVNEEGNGRLSVTGNANAESPDLHIQADKIDLGYIMDMVNEIVDLSAPPEEEAPNKEGEDKPVEDNVAIAGDGKRKTSEQSPKKSPDQKKDSEAVAATEPENPLEGLTGKASMDFKVKGDGNKLNAKGWITIDDFVMPKQVAGIDTRVEIDVTDDHVDLTVVVGDDKKTFFRMKGDIPVKQKAGVAALDCDGQLKLRSYIPGVRFKRLAKQVPALGELDGRLSMNVGLAGEACNPDVDLVAAVTTPVGPQGEAVRVDLTFDRKGDDIKAVALVEQENEQIARVGLALATTLTDALRAMLRDKKEVDIGNPQVWLKEYDVKLALLGANLGQLARMGQVTHPIQGILAGGVNIYGTMEEPKLESGLVMVNGQVGGAEVKQFTVALTEGEGGFDLETVMSFQEEGHLDIKGFLPLDLKFNEDLDLTKPGFDIEISGDGLPIALGAGPTGLSKAKGTIGLQGSVTGTLEKPVPELRLVSNVAGFTLLPTALRYDPIEIDIGYRPDGVDINELKVTTSQIWGASPGKGYFRLNGRVDLGDEGPEKMDLKVKMKKFWVSSTRAASIATSGDIAIEGDYPALNVKGKVKLNDASLAVGAEVLKDTGSFDVDESIKIHRENLKLAVREEEEDEGPSIADQMSVDLDVKLNSAVNLKADIPMSEDFGAQFAQLATLSVDLGLDGRLRIQQEKGQLSMLGELQTLRGEAVAMGKRFNITEGTITFTGENYANPQLNLGASHQVGQYGSVDIKIGGDVENTAMDLSSPEYPDQTDVMSMLLFGKPTSAMSETEGESGAGLLSAAMASVGGQAARSTGAAFLQNVAVDPGSGSVKVGFPLTDKIYLSIERVRPETDTDNMTQAALEWLLSRRAYGEVMTGDKGQSSGDVFLRWRF